MDLGRLVLLTMGGGFDAVERFWFKVEVGGCVLLLIGDCTLFERMQECSVVFLSDHLVLLLSVSMITLSDCADFCLGLHFHRKLSNLPGPSLLFKLLVIKFLCGLPSTSDLIFLWPGNLKRLLAISDFESFDSSLINLIFSFTFAARGDFVSEMTKVLDLVLRGAASRLSCSCLLDAFPPAEYEEGSVRVLAVLDGEALSRIEMNVKQRSAASEGLFGGFFSTTGDS